MPDRPKGRSPRPGLQGPGKTAASCADGQPVPPHPARCGVAVVPALMPFIACLDFSPLAGIAIKLAMLIGGTVVIVFVLDLKNSGQTTA